jgi:hypothetical protein
MSHGCIPPEPRPPLYVVTHGLTLTAYVDGLPVAVKRLAPHEAANLAIDLLTGLRMSLGNTQTLDGRLSVRVQAIIDGDYPRPVAVIYRKDGQASKHDLCAHALAMYVDCPDCMTEALRAALSRSTQTPTENLPFRAHEANRRDDGVTIHADHEEQP